MLPLTEQDNPNTSAIDTASTLDALRLINHEDKLVAEAVEKVLPQVALATDQIVDRLKNGGRLFYIGTGTSGRLGVLDASEIPPTFGVSPDLIQGIIAGGYDALYKATEASEDDKNAGSNDLRTRGINSNDAVIGIAASGSTPYTIGAVEYARSLGCFTACIVCTPDSALASIADIAIEPLVGSEAITGSTRMKAGTAQKLILNMISTVTLIRLGYVKGNRMTNLRPSNEKLRKRTLRILMSETGLEAPAAAELLAAANGDQRVALVMHRTGAEPSAALEALENNDFIVDLAADSLTQ